MGCFWSCDGAERCQHCNRKAFKDFIIINNECQFCLNRTTRPQERIQRRGRALFGEYRCSCGREWQSRRSWSGCPQDCLICRRTVYPHTQRKLRPSDMSRDQKNIKDHPMELCHMCKELGDYCGNLG